MILGQAILEIYDDLTLLRTTITTPADGPYASRAKRLSDADVSGGAAGISAICSRPEVDDDVISGNDVETFRMYQDANLSVASFSSFPENRNQPLTLHPFGPHFWCQEAKMSKERLTQKQVNLFDIGEPPLRNRDPNMTTN